MTFFFRCCFKTIASSGMVGALVLFLASGSASAADATPLPSMASPSFWSLPSWPGPPSRGPTLRVGAYVGALNNDPLVNILVVPWTTKLQPDYIVVGQAIYTAYRFQKIPIDLEVEADIGHRFGQSHETDFDLIPMARLRWLPWNNYVYSTFRLGVFGASYATGISKVEVARSGNHKGSQFLNFLVPELTFARAADSPWEVFFRIHHRSGIYGVIDGVHGGSNYVSGGVRFGLF